MGRTVAELTPRTVLGQWARDHESDERSAPVYNRATNAVELWLVVRPVLLAKSKLVLWRCEVRSGDNKLVLLSGLKKAKDMAQAWCERHVDGSGSDSVEVAA